MNSPFFNAFNLVPLLLFPVLWYAVLAFSAGGAPGEFATWIAAPWTSVHNFSGEIWTLSLGDAIVIVTILIFFFELLKATRTDGRALVNHALATLVFVVSLILFITTHGFSTTTYFLILLIQLVDVVAGYAISVVVARRQFGTPGGIIGTS